MATQTAHFELEKPALTDVADIAVLNNNFDDIDTVMFANQERSVAAVSNQADAYDAAQTYAVGDLVIYENQLYKCTTAVTVAEPWDSTKWTQTTLAESGGAEVEANPTGTPTDTLETIDINGTVYEVGESEPVSKTVTGNPINIADAADAPIVGGEVTFEPKQDLHGYDKPWVGGNGKNLLQLNVDGLKTLNTQGTWNGNVFTFNDVDFTINTDADNNVVSINVNGTPTANATFYLQRNITAAELPSSYIVNGCPSSGSTSTYLERVQMQGSPNTNIATDVGEGTNSFSFGEDTYQIFIRVANGFAANNLVFKPMLRLATESDPTFEPYSNICPITGYDDCEVEVTGKNLIYAIGGDRTNNGVAFTTVDGLVTANGTATAAAWYMSADSATYSNSIPVKAGTYTISGGISSVRLDVYEVLSDDTKNLITNTNTSPTFTLDHDAHVFYNIRVANGLTIDHTFEIQLERGSTATEFEHYQSTTHTIDLDGTRYGGTVDLVSGEMTVDKVKENVTFNSFSTTQSGNALGRVNNSLPAKGFPNNVVSSAITDTVETISASSLYRQNLTGVSVNEQGAINMAVKDIATSAALTEWLQNNPTEICYELATPFTVQLTPQQIRTLQGKNNITTNMTTMSLNYITGSYQPLVDLAEENSSSEIKYGNRHSYLAEVNTDHTYTFEELGISRAGTYLVSVASITNQPSWGWFYFGVLFNADRTDTYQCTQLYGIKSNRITATLNETDKTISFRNTGDNQLTFHIEVLPMSNV